MANISKININIPSFNESWILTKFAQKMFLEINNLSEVNCIINGPRNEIYDVTHHIPYYDAVKTRSKIDSYMITHIDNEDKIKNIINISDELDVGICMSKDTMKKLSSIRGISNIEYVLPAHDNDGRKRKIHIGIASNLYIDGRKNEESLINNFALTDVKEFKLIVMGLGWESTVLQLTNLGLEVEYISVFDHELYYEYFFKNIDYLLYVGFDEGSMSFLDACRLGIKTIVTYQGFHKDLKRSITHRIVNQYDLSKVLTLLTSQKRQIMSGVIELSWKTYVDKHFVIWNKYLNNN
jgi:hypothetical protein